MPTSIADIISQFFAGAGATAKSAVKMLLQSRPAVFPKVARNSPLYILGNGPSLREVLDNHTDFLRARDTLAVNFAANTPDFFIVRPKFYVLADPHFFQNTADPNVSRLIESLNRVDWPMTLFIPAKARLAPALITNPSITIARFNFVAAEGFGWFEKLAFNRKWGMPRPRNVLIPSIMTGLWLGYREIYLLGADHSWLTTLTVDSDNRVASVQPHFYKEDEQEQQRIRKAYLSLPLHSVLESFYVAFKAYHTIQRYATSIGAVIYNATCDSFIDAFPRRPLR